jgi:hypothetical protein
MSERGQPSRAWFLVDSSTSATLFPRGSRIRKTGIYESHLLKNVHKISSMAFEASDEPGGVSRTCCGCLFVWKSHRSLFALLLGRTTFTRPSCDSRPGTGTATPAPASTLSRATTPSNSTRSSTTNGTGRSSTPPKPNSWTTSAISLNVTSLKT